MHAQQRDAAVRLERRIAGQDLVQNDAQAVKIAARIRCSSFDLLGADIQRRAHDRDVRFARERAEIAGRAEVREDVAPAVLAHDVAGFEVSVDEARGMHRGQRLSHRRAEPGRFLRAHRTVRPQLLLERDAANELHPEADAAAIDVGAVDGHDVRVSDTRQAAGFGEQRLVDVRAAKHFEGDLFAQLRIPCAVHGAEGARHLGHWIRQRPKSLGPHEILEIREGEAVEALPLVALGRGGLHDPDPRQSLLKVAAHFAGELEHLPVTSADAAEERTPEREDRRQHDDRGKREPPRNEHHHAERRR